MKIRTRLTVQFLILGGIITILTSLAIYYLSASYRKDDFFSRLESKANVTARLLIEVEEIDSTLLQKIERDNPISLPNEKVIIYNYKNDILFSTDEKKVIKTDSLLYDQIRLEGEVRFKQGLYEVIGILYKEKYDRFVVIAGATDIFGLSKMKNLKIVLAIVFIVSLFLYSIAGWFYSGKALQPILKSIGQVEKISIASLNLRLDEGNGIDEIAKLAMTFNKMLERLEEAFKLQKDFISNASHELRNPLTSLHGQLEVLLMRDRTIPDYKATILSVLEDIRQLTDLSNRLLLLAQATSESVGTTYAQIRIDETLWQVREELQKSQATFKINVFIDNSLYEADQMSILGDEYLIKIAISNIIENGCKYTDNHTVDVKLEYLNKYIAILFTDKGIGIPEKDLVHLFEPFHRGSNVAAIEGHGIGLPLVYQIVKNHHGSIEINSKIGIGTTVCVRFPIA
jgi:signal transduction histidine kinase